MFHGSFKSVFFVTFQPCHSFSDAKLFVFICFFCPQSFSLDVLSLSQSSLRLYCTFRPALSFKSKSRGDFERQKDYTNETNLYGLLKKIIHTVRSFLLLIKRRLETALLFSAILTAISVEIHYLSQRTKTQYPAIDWNLKLIAENEQKQSVKQWLKVSVALCSFPFGLWCPCMCERIGSDRKSTLIGRSKKI